MWGILGLIRVNIVVHAKGFLRVYIGVLRVLNGYVRIDRVSALPKLGAPFRGSYSRDYNILGRMLGQLPYNSQRPLVV